MVGTVSLVHILLESGTSRPARNLSKDLRFQIDVAGWYTERGRLSIGAINPRPSFLLNEMDLGRTNRQTFLIYSAIRSCQGNPLVINIYQRNLREIIVTGTAKVQLPRTQSLLFRCAQWYSHISRRRLCNSTTRIVCLENVHDPSDILGIARVVKEGWIKSQRLTAHRIRVDAHVGDEQALGSRRGGRRYRRGGLSRCPSRRRRGGGGCRRCGGGRDIKRQGWRKG